jgi:hypothetical protein
MARELRQGTVHDVGDHKVGVTSVYEGSGARLVSLTVLDPGTRQETAHRLTIGDVFSVGGDRYRVTSIELASGAKQGSITIAPENERVRPEGAPSGDRGGGAIMTQPKDPKAEMQQRTKDLARALLEALEPDPQRDAERAAYEAEKEKEDAARILEFHLSKQLPPVEVPPHPSVSLADLAALEDYLGRRGVAFERVPGGITLSFMSMRVKYTIAIEWSGGQVRLTTLVPTVAIPAEQRGKLAAAIERVNAQIGQPLWRLTPGLVARVVASTDDDGTVSTGVVEEAIAVIRAAVFRDPPIFRMAMRS